MKVLFAIGLVLGVVGCTAPNVPKYDERAASTRLQKELEARDQANAPREQLERKAKAQHEHWLADKRGARYLELHPATKAEIKQAILAGRLIVGMSPDEAWAAVGPMLPQSESDGLGGSVTLWKTTEGIPLYLRFAKEQLVRWSD